MLLVIMALCVKDESTQKRDELRVRHQGFGYHRHGVNIDRRRA